MPSRGENRLPSALAAVAGLVGALALVLLAARSQRTLNVRPRARSTRAPSLPDVTSPAQTATPRPLTPATDNSHTTTILTLVVVVALLAVLIPLLVWLARRARRMVRAWPHRHRAPNQTLGEIAAEDPLVDQTLAAAIDTGLARLDQGPVREAIVACWIELERSAVGSGVPLLPSETSAELATRLFALRHVDRTALDRLADLYREARFSTHRLDERRRAEARYHLEELRDQLLLESERRG